MVMGVTDGLDGRNEGIFLFFLGFEKRGAFFSFDFDCAYVPC